MQTRRHSNEILSGNTHYLSVCVWWLLFGEKMAKSAREICSLFTTTSTLPSLHTLHITQCNDLCVGRLSSSLFAACCINEIFIFVLKKLFLQFLFQNRVAQISWSTVQGKHSAINTQYNEHIVQWGVWGVQSSQQLSQTSHLASDGGCMMGRWNRF